MPLSEMIVIEFASVLAGPSVGMFFAELGSRVIKVENFASGGDVTRSWRLAGESPADLSAYFSCVNWGKESIGLDLRTQAGGDLARALVLKADIVLVSFKPGDALKLGLDYPTVQSINPRAVYCEVTAYGPDDTRVGYDAVIQAETGFTYLNGTPESGPVKMPVALMDVLAAHQLKQGCLIALLEQARTGRGSLVSASLVRSGLASLINQASNWLLAGVSPGRLGSGHPNIVPYGTAWETADGEYIVLAIGSDRQFRDLSEVLQIPDVAADERYATNPARVANRGSLEELLAEQIRRMDRTALLRSLADKHVPAGSINDVPSAVSGPAAEALLMESAGTRGLRSVALEASETYHPAELLPPPALCADTKRVLTELLGCDEKLIDTYAQAGAVGLP